MDRGLLLGGDPEEVGLEAGCWLLLCTSQPGWGRHHAEAPVGRWVVGPEPGRPECLPLAVRPPPLTLLSRLLDSVLPAPLPTALLGPHGGLTTEPASWTLSGMLGIQLVLNTCLMKESLATETQWTQQASGQPSGQCRLARSLLIWGTSYFQLQMLWTSLVSTLPHPRIGCFSKGFWFLFSGE